MMGINAKDLVRAELIGKDIEILGAKNKSLIGLKGKIIDETKSTFIILTEGKRKMVLKTHIKMVVKIAGMKVLVDGKLLARRPEDRINLKVG